MLMQQREEAAGRQLPGIEALKKAFKSFSERAPLLAQMPGPLKTDRLPALSMLDFPSQNKAELTQRVDELAADPSDDNWARFAHLSRFVRFDEYILARMTEIIPRINYSPNENDFLSNTDRLTSIAFVELLPKGIVLWLKQSLPARVRKLKKRPMKPRLSL